MFQKDSIGKSLSNDRKKKWSDKSEADTIDGDEKEGDQQQPHNYNSLQIQNKLQIRYKDNK